MFVPENIEAVCLEITKTRARVLIPLGDLLHPGILTNIGESKIVQILCHGRWTFNGHGCYAHA